MDLLDAVSGQRATRHFRNTPVPRATIVRILDAARWTGSARNRQPWRFVAVADGEVQRRLAQCGRYAGHLGTAPAVIVLLSDPEAGSDTDFDMGRLCQSVVLAADAMGIGSCPATFFPDDNTVRAARICGAPAPWQAVHALAVGFPAAAPHGRSAVPTGRTPLDRILTCIGWEDDGA
ncbi:nitroreductase family protein [Tomitella gaofuii]|uniref:nitroreductase family protein n=1 Tax=Tomitella gaofuii TaxID=2760083 RepID=UPI0015F99E6E|nr:nitroreductase family protein [Tomitella gaofuii]